MRTNVGFGTVVLALACVAPSAFAQGGTGSGKQGKWQLKDVDRDMQSDYEFDKTLFYLERGHAASSPVKAQGETQAFDFAPFRESLVVLNAAGGLFECWRYLSEDPEDEGEIEAIFTLRRNPGYIHLVNPPCAGIVGISVGYEHTIGKGSERELGVLFGRSTESEAFGQVGWGGFSLQMAFGVGEGFYELPAVTPHKEYTDDCQDSYQYWHKTAIYMETWSNGWHGGLAYNYSEARSKAEARVASEHFRITCPE